ncbi:HAD family hydrolase [Paludibacter sp. 221]|uniref:HAD family hydrolase n=1 Tax=Paludibacter sp. 221 TaxID=2302939 RepID=UPI0013D3E5A4|nr:HAD-IA family hydrolase [Paludibacter sp. 221]NDV46415.1 HAD family hydrolase [Paludibacter sp. 221]
MYSSAISSFIKKNDYPGFSPKAILFDMDGVLFDSMEGHVVAWIKAMHEYGLPFTREDVYMCEGQTGATTINKSFIETHGREATEEEKQEIYKLKSHYFDEYGKPAPMPFAPDLLKEIKKQGLQAIVVTGSGQPSLLKSIENSFPGIFEHDKMVTAFDVKYGKPHPEPYLMAVKKSGVKPWEVIAIDNAPLGVKSASSANLFTIGLNTGPLEPEVLLEYGANVVLDSMEDLAKQWGHFTKT